MEEEMKEIFIYINDKKVTITQNNQDRTKLNFGDQSLSDDDKKVYGEIIDFFKKFIK
jgi:hypothetical protein